MCTPPEGYVKSGYDFLFKEHTYFWNKTLCKYVLLSTLFDMLDAEYASYHSDPNYAAMFTDGGGGSENQIDINNGSNAGGKTSDYYKQMISLLTPSKPQSKKKNALVIILIVAAVALAGYGIYRYKIKK